MTGLLVQRLLSVKVLRFAVVGVACTAIYYGVTITLASALIGLPMAVASLLGFAVSLLASYFSHLNFTYKRQGHQHYGWRFAIATTALTLLFSLLSQYAVEQLHVGKTMAVGLVALLYPPSSFVLHTFWTFAERKSRVPVAEGDGQRFG